jgi:hypothetical protein
MKTCGEANFSIICRRQTLRPCRGHGPAWMRPRHIKRGPSRGFHPTRRPHSAVPRSDTELPAAPIGRLRGTLGALVRGPARPCLTLMPPTPRGGTVLLNPAAGPLAAPAQTGRSNRPELATHAVSEPKGYPRAKADSPAVLSRVNRRCPKCCPGRKIAMPCRGKNTAKSKSLIL